MMIKAQALGEAYRCKQVTSSAWCWCRCGDRRKKMPSSGWCWCRGWHLKDDHSMLSNSHKSTSLFFLALSAANSLWLAHIAERVEHDLQMLF